MEHLSQNSQSPAGIDGARLLWCDLVRQIGWETEESVRAALTDLQDCLQTGHIDRQLLSDLRRSLQRAKQIGTAGRQIACIAAGSLRQTPQHTPVADLLRQSIAQRSSLVRARGLILDRQFAKVDVMADRDLLLALTDNVVTWALEHAQRKVELKLECAGSTGRLCCRFDHKTNGPKLSRFGGPAAWGASWQLVRHVTHALQWSMRSDHDDTMTWLAVEFACEAHEAAPEVEVIELDADSVAEFEALAS